MASNKAIAYLITKLEQTMATEPKKIHNFDEQSVKMLRRAMSKLEQSASRFLTTAQKEENDKAVASAREDLALIAIIKTQL